MRPDPDLPAFSMDLPLRIGHALLLTLGLLLPLLLKTHRQSNTPQTAGLARDADRTAQRQMLQHKMDSNSQRVPAAFKEQYGAPRRNNSGRPVPAGLPLQLKLSQASIRDLIELLVRNIQYMRKERGWEGTIIAARLINNSSAKLQLDQAIRGVTQAKMLPKQTLDAINEIFYQVPGSTSDPVAAAAAMRRANEQAAIKAAAKKAKKQRQKLKAKEQAQAESSASVAESHDAPIPSDEAQPLSPESSQLTMDLSESSPSAGLHQAENPAAQSLEHQPQLDEARGSSLSVSAPLGDTAARVNGAVDVSVELQVMHSSSSHKTAKKGQTDADFLQQLFCCPLTKATMVDPAIAADGHTYERSAIQDWLAHSRTSPVTGQRLSHTRLVSNQAARVAIACQLGRVQ
ncbi:MAG: hypothetical protein FRX49_11581 [Trebouxia sp. A1-2]|nr:MAG: hypothetical protein FRX49_11581 [Trebouxia sp. A1-2]